MSAAPFRYWGGKVRMAPWIIDRLPVHDHFVEVCAGSAAVLAAKPRSICETVNDTYGEVVNFFRVLRDVSQAEALIERVAFTPYSLLEFNEAGSVSADAPPVDRAWAFFIRMQMAVVPGRSGWSYAVAGRNGQIANKPGRWSTMPAHLAWCAARFANVHVSDWDALDVLDRLDAPDVCMFVDPPYLEESRPSSVGASSAYEHDAFDHEAFVARTLEVKHASVVISHYPHPLYDAAFVALGDYESHRNIPNGDGRERVRERLYGWRSDGPSQLALL